LDCFHYFGPDSRSDLETAMIKSGQKIEPGQRLVVLGLGISGRAAIKFLVQQGAMVSISDSRTFEQLAPEDQEYIRKHNLPFEGGGHTLAFCEDCDALFVSPGIQTNIRLLQELRAKNIPVMGELAIAAPYLSETVVAVTGTNGKTTVTALLGELLKSSGKEAFVGGNIGTPLLDYLRLGNRGEFVVLELSSFQLASAGSFRPHIGILLNVTPDHLDWHGSMENYTAAKMKMFAHQKKDDIAILCADDPICMQQESHLNGQQKYCYGSVDNGCVAEGSGKQFTISLSGKEDTRYSLEGTALDSYTGLLNCEAAVLAASLLGCKQQELEQGLQKFRLAKHRLQLVRTRAGVSFYNDSKATNTGAVISALASFQGDVLLIAGGKDKGEEYGVLTAAVQDKVKELILIGEAADAIDSALTAHVHTQRAASMDEAVKIAADLAVAGDTVLLAPACASFDMFDNYGQRGDIFMQSVLSLPEVVKGQAS
jgi:UDP-N-acetylmuramoylalanine--D-glutamate ligase